MKPAIRRLARHVLGWGSLVLGVAGLVLPVVQGLFFIAVGLILLSPDVPLFRRILARAERHLPALGPHLDRARRKVAGRGEPPAPPPAEP